MARAKTIRCNAEIDLHLHYDTDEIAKKYRMDMPKVNITVAKDNDGDDTIVVVGVKPDHHPMNREDRRRYDRAEKKHLDQLANYSTRVRKTRSGVNVRDRSNDGCKAYLKGDKLWSRKIRHQRFEVNDDLMADSYASLDDLMDIMAEDAPKRYDSDAIHHRMDDLRPFEPKMYIVVYSYDSWEDYYEVEKFYTSMMAVINEVKSHEISDNENDLTIYGLFQSDYTKCDKAVIYHSCALD